MKFAKKQTNIYISEVFSQNLREPGSSQCPHSYWSVVSVYGVANCLLDIQVGTKPKCNFQVSNEIHSSYWKWVWGGDLTFFKKLFAVKFPAHGQIIPVKCKQISPPRGCTLLSSIPRQNPRKAQWKYFQINLCNLYL